MLFNLSIKISDIKIAAKLPVSFQRSTIRSQQIQAQKSETASDPKNRLPSSVFHPVYDRLTKHLQMLCRKSWNRPQTVQLCCRPVNRWNCRPVNCRMLYRRRKKRRMPCRCRNRQMLYQPCCRSRRSKNCRSLNRLSQQMCCLPLLRLCHHQNRSRNRMFLHLNLHPHFLTEQSRLPRRHCHPKSCRRPDC